MMRTTREPVQPRSSAEAGAAGAGAAQAEPHCRAAQAEPHCRAAQAEPRRRAAVLGHPVAHSLSPVIHNAGYRAAGLAGWAYTAVECAEADLPGLVAGLDDRWVGLSLTMPLKLVAPGVADQSSDLVGALGAANTLVRRPDGWYAENTDAPGMVDVLRGLGVAGPQRVAVLGAGGTARAALGAAVQLGASEAVVYARRRGAVAALSPVADRLGLGLTPVDWRYAAGCTDLPVVISTVPAGAADDLAGAASWQPDTALLDVIYHPWPTALAGAAGRAGVRIASGLDLLLAQAVRQFELFTGVKPAPVDAMRRALHAAV